MSEQSDIRKIWKKAEEEDLRLFDAWNLREDWKAPAEKVSWPLKLQERFNEEGLSKERWGVLRVRNEALGLMDGARIMHRGDAQVWGSSSNGSYRIVGDLDLAWQGRSPLFEVKAALPAVRLHVDGKPFPPAEGLDWPQRQDYLNEQERSGRPLYVVWVWPFQEGAPSANEGEADFFIRGQRVDKLEWPPPASSINRLKAKGHKMAYWRIEDLLSLEQIAQDIEGWGGAPFQTALA